MAIVWLLPAVLAALALGVQMLVGSQSFGGGYLMLWATSVLVLISPAFSWFGLVLVSPLVAILLDRGWFGWLPALALGVAAGGAVGWLLNSALAVSFGAILLMGLRAALGRLYPAAFRPD